MNLIISLLTNVSIALILISVAFWLPQLNTYVEKQAPTNAALILWDPLDFLFHKVFLVAITFLLFDLEIALLLPLPWASQTNNLQLMLTVALMLLLVLTLGLAYEWIQKGLEWVE
uniref:NADH-ubiquinone oxidoreductase chain 3 n=1 Tax=Sundasciurus lowii TaxID=1002722 RepID=A0A6M2QMN1_9SCIU|nr:NADH dehydrogenase subunit 3 [Sundasciurus lowii]